MVRNRSDKSTSEKAYSPIALPNTGNNKAMTMTTIIAMVKAIAMSRATIKERFSSTLYARLNAFVIALTPFDADHNVATIPIDNKPVCCALTHWLIFVLIKCVISVGAYVSINSMSIASLIGK